LGTFSFSLVVGGKCITRHDFQHLAMKKFAWSGGLTALQFGRKVRIQNVPNLQLGPKFRMSPITTLTG